MKDTIFVLFFVGITLLFVGAGAYVVTVDYDYVYYSMGEEEDRTVGATIYESMSEERQSNVDRALTADDGRVRIEDRSDVPGLLIKKDGVYYAFRMEEVRDTSEGGSPVALAALLLGGAMLFESFRQSYFKRRLSMPWDGALRDR